MWLVTKKKSQAKELNPCHSKNGYWYCFCQYTICASSSFLIRTIWVALQTRHVEKCQSCFLISPHSTLHPPWLLHSTGPLLSFLLTFKAPIVFRELPPAHHVSTTHPTATSRLGYTCYPWQPPTPWLTYPGPGVYITLATTQWLRWPCRYHKYISFFWAIPQKRQLSLFAVHSKVTSHVWFDYVIMTITFMVLPSKAPLRDLKKK